MSNTNDHKDNGSGKSRKRMPQARSYLPKKARELRHSPTKAHSLLWERLRNKNLGYKFRRHHPIDQWIIDFYCCELRLAVEIDYPSDEQRVEKYDYRDNSLAEFEVQMLRFPSNRIYDDLDQVVSEIEAVAKRKAL